MTWPADLEQKLGFDQIRTMLKNYCLCDLGRRNVDSISFNSDLATIDTLLRRTVELQNILLKGDAFPSQIISIPKNTFRLFLLRVVFLKKKLFT